MSEDQVEVVRTMLNAFNRDDVEAVVASFDEGCEIIEPFEMPDRPALGFRGHQGIREWMANLRGTAGADSIPGPSPRQAISCSVSSARVGAAEASGVRVEGMTFAVIRIRDGKIEQVRVFLD